MNEQLSNINIIILKSHGSLALLGRLIKTVDSVITSKHETKLTCSHNARGENELPPDTAYDILLDVEHSRPVHKPLQLFQHPQTEAGDFVYNRSQIFQKELQKMKAYSPHATQNSIVPHVWTSKWNLINCTLLNLRRVLALPCFLSQIPSAMELYCKSWLIFKQLKCIHSVWLQTYNVACI